MTAYEGSKWQEAREYQAAPRIPTTPKPAGQTPEQMVEALRKLGYKVRHQPTGFYLIRYIPEGETQMRHHIRRTRAAGPWKNRLPAQAEIAEIDMSLLKWSPFWDVAAIEGPGETREGRDNATSA